MTQAKDKSIESEVQNHEVGVMDHLTIGGSGVRFLDFNPAGDEVPPLDEHSIVARVRSTVLDRLAGTVVTEAIWRAEPNLNAIMKRATDPTVREICGRFFTEYQLAVILRDVLPPRLTVEEGFSMLMPQDLFKAIDKRVGNSNASFVLMELINSFLVRCGIMVDTTAFTTRSYYPFAPVTVAKLANDIAMQEVVRALGTVKSAKLADRKYTSASFAETVAEALYPIGKAFFEVNELGGILEDIVRGIRKFIDPDLHGLAGNVDAAWANNPVVTELAGNYVFLSAALTFDGSVSPINEGWKLSQYAPGILTALKASSRYAIVNKSEVTRNLGLKKIRDLRGLPVSFVLWRSAAPQAVAQAVFAFQDARLSIATTVTPTKERIADAVASAYGDANALGTNTAVKVLTQFLTHAVEAGYRGLRDGYYIDLGEFTTVSDHEVAAMMAESIRIQVDTETGKFPVVEEGKLVPRTGWWFKVETHERDFPFSYSGKLLDTTTLITDQINEVFMAVDEFEPAGTVEPRPQLIAPMAYDTRMVGFDPETDLVGLDTRFSFDTTIAGHEVRGSFRAADIGTLRVNAMTSLVVPAFNRDVFNAVASVFNVIAEELKRMFKRAESGDKAEAPEEVVAFLKRQYARELLDYSKHLSEGFRQEVENGMRERAVSKMSPEDAFVMRARLAQREFGGYADVNALLLFLALQGINGDPWKDALKQADMVATMMDYGTDRKKKIVQ